MIQIEKITRELAQSLCRKITMDLPEYFGLPEANEHYAEGVKARTNFAAKKNDNYLGLISIDFPYPNNANISIKALDKSDIPAIVDAFQKANWLKPAALFEAYYQEHKLERIVWLAYSDDQLAGYITLKWISQYQPFANISKKLPKTIFSRTISILLFL